MNNTPTHEKPWQQVADGAQLYLRPRSPAGPMSPAERDGLVELITCDGGTPTRTQLTRRDVEDWAANCGGARQARITTLLAQIDSARHPVCGVGLEQPRIMAVVNVTLDSFSDGGKNFDSEVAIRAGREMAAAGADIIDVGGVSTRPGASPPSPAEELARVLPVIRALAEAGLIVSIDTRRAAVMAAGLDAGGQMINDVSALTADPESLSLAAHSEVPIVLMHMQGDPETMQKAPTYDHVSLDVFDFLEERIAACIAAGVPRHRLIVDPGIGFGKTIPHNLQILRDLALFHGLGCPLLVGLSRKYFIGALSNRAPAAERMPGSIAGALHAISQGAQIVRVHDVGETSQAIKIWQAIRGDNADYM